MSALLAFLLWAQAPPAALDGRPMPHAVLRPVPARDVKLLPGFWLDRVETNRASLRAGWEQLRKIGAFDNFRVAAGAKEGKHQVYVFTDSDCYKWLEAACLQLGLHGPDPDLKAQVDELAGLVVAAMEPDGYVMTKYTIEKLPRWHNLAFDHELYCMGHLIQAAIAHRRAFGDGEFFRRVCTTADLICRTFPGEREGACGHPEIELALIELHRETGERRYLETARYFLDRRGVEPKVAGGLEYMQDHKPLREQREAVGHAVRALYLYGGAADLFLETGDPTLPPVLQDLWSDLHYYKTYVTGGVGARHDGEAIGARYELPNKEAYSETCAAIASVLFNHRMLCLTGDARHGDAMETALYNNVLAAVSLDGTKFFYVNPLETDGGHRRKEWYACACCPPNIMRTIANIGGMMFLARENALYVNLYGSCEVDTKLPGGQRAHMRVKTGYPVGWNVFVEALEGNEVTDVRFRAPAWAEGLWSKGPTFTLGGPTMDEREEVGAETLAGGWVALRRWEPPFGVHLGGSVVGPVTANLIEANPALVENRGKVCLQAGPLVYAFESVDNPGIPLADTSIQLETSKPGTLGWLIQRRLDALGGVMVLEGPGLVPEEPAGPEAANDLYRLYSRLTTRWRPVRLTAIPYFAWANRGDSRMRIWMPVAE